MPKKTVKDENGNDVEIEVKEDETPVETPEVPKGLSEEEVQKIIEKVRKEEKDKLYPTIEGLKNSVESLKESNEAEKADKERIKKEAEEAEEAARVAKLSDSQRTAETLKKIEERLNQESTERAKFKAEIDRRDQQDKLSRYKAQAIAVAGPEIIEELVSGNSEEEIDKSVAKAKARYEELVGVKKQRDAEQVRNALTSTSPSTEAFEEEEIRERGLANVDRDKYLVDPDYRAKIQGELERTVNKAYGR